MNYPQAANSIIKQIMKEKKLRLRQNEREELTRRVARILKNKHTESRSIDNGLTPKEKEDEVVNATIREICKNDPVVKNVSDAIKDEDELP